MTEESLQKELDLERVDNEQNFFNRLEISYPKVAGSLKDFLTLKSPNAVYRIQKFENSLFGGQFIGKTQKGIGALILDSKYYVGVFENFTLNGPGVLFLADSVVEGIFENNNLKEKKTLGLLHYSRLSN